MAVNETTRSDRQKIADWQAALEANPIHGKTKVEIDAWIETNVTTLATAKVALKWIGEYIAIIDKVIPYLIEKTGG